MRPIHTLAAVAVLFAPFAAQAKDKPVVSLAKTSKWEINYDDDSCHLLAKFGEGSQALVLRLSRSSFNDALDLALYGEALKPLGSEAPVEAGFQPTRLLVKRMAHFGTTSDNRPLLMARGLRLDNWTSNGQWKASRVSDAPAIPPDRETKITGLEVRIGTRGYLLETGSLSGPMQAMRACATDLVKSWGFDPQVQTELSRQSLPLNYPGNWVTTHDYPSGSLRSGTNGLVQFRLDVDDKGKVADCKVLFRTKPDDFGSHTCSLLKMRAKMSAALDRDGKPVRSFYVGSVSWVVPES